MKKQKSNNKNTLLFPVHTHSKPKWWNWVKFFLKVHCVSPKLENTTCFDTKPFAVELASCILYLPCVGQAQCGLTLLWMYVVCALASIDLPNQAEPWPMKLSDEACGTTCTHRETLCALQSKSVSMLAQKKSNFTASSFNLIALGNDHHHFTYSL